MLPTTLGTASLRQTSRLRRTTGQKRGVMRGAAYSEVSISDSGVVADLPASELQEQILEVGRAMQVAHRVVGGKCVEERLGLAQVEEHRLAAGLDAVGERRQRLSRRRGALAIDLDHVAFQMRGDQAARRSFGDLAPVIEHEKAIAKPLGLVHEVSRQQNRLALLQQILQTFPHQMACLRVESGGRLVENKQVRVVDQRAAETETAPHAAGELAGTDVRLRL